MFGRSGAVAACARAVNLDFSRRGKPTDNVPIKSFRGRPPAGLTGTGQLGQ